MQNTWDSVLEQLLSESSVKQQIQTQGFYLSDLPFKQFTKKYNFTPAQNTATYLSLDFWSQQPKTLIQNDMYLLRIGGGKFAILDKNKIPSSYLQLELKNVKKLEIESSGFPELLDAFKIRQENAGLELLNALGVYDLLIKNLFGDKEWKIGPRGQTTSSFPVYAKDTTGNTQLIYNYSGLEELDYSIWTQDHTLLIEAKSLKTNLGLDVGWHKLVYPASRFQKYSKYKIKPVYFLKWETMVHLFVFPDLRFYDSGIIVNDSAAFAPEHIFRIDLEKTRLDF